MAAIRDIATALEARATKLNTYAIVPHIGSVDTATLARALEPTYIRKMPRLDGWGNGMRFTSDADTYAIRSIGSDHRADRDLKPKGAVHHFQDDIVYAGGSFVQYPEGAG